VHRGRALDPGAMQEMTIRVAPEMKAMIARVASERECSIADVAREALRDWAARHRETERRQEADDERC
jgi:Arc/MetJ-type ribon-helix-helix transcriptional regulator